MEPLFAFLASTEDASLALIGLAMAVARPFGFVLACPVFSRFGLQAGILRGAILVALSVPVIPVILGQLVRAGAPPDIADLPLLLVRELGVGVLIGLIVGLPLWAAAAAGDYLDMQRGASMANLVEPGSGAETSVTGTLLFLLSVLWLIAAGIFVPAVFGPLYASYQVVPPLAPLELPGAERGVEALRLLDQLGRAGLVLALPILVPLFLTEVVFAIATKYVQQMNGMFLAMSAKQAVHAVLMVVYATTLVAYVAGAMGDPGTLTALARFFEAP